MELSGHYAKDDYNGAANTVVRSVDSIPTAGQTAGADLFVGRGTNANQIYSTEKEVYGINAELNWALDSLNIRSVLGSFNLDADQVLDLDGTILDGGYFRTIDDQRQISWDTTITSDDSSWIKWLVGTFFYKEKNEASLRAESQGAAPFPYLYIAGSDIETTSYAIYAQSDVEFLDNLVLTLGGRYSKDKKEMEEALFFGAPIGTAELEDTWASFTPKIVLTYLPTEGLTLYASAGNGYKSGGFNGGGLQGLSFDEEKVWSYEAGLKSTLFDNRLRTNFAGYYSKYEDLQVTQVINVAAETLNAASATIWGVELEADFVATDRLRFDLVTSYLHAEFDEFRTKNEAFPEVGIMNLSGNQLPRSPSFAVITGAQYEFPIGNLGDLSFRAEYQYRSEVYLTQFNRDESRQDSVSRVNLRIGIADFDGSWAIDAYVENLTDELAATSGNRAAGFLGFPMYEYLDPPRTYGVRLRYHF